MKSLLLFKYATIRNSGERISRRGSKRGSLRLR